MSETSRLRGGEGYAVRILCAPPRRLSSPPLVGDFYKIEAQRSGFDFERRSDGMSETSRLRGGEGYGVRDDVVTLRHARGLRPSFCHAAAAARRAASLRLGLKTGLLRSPSVFRPRSGPSALLRTPPRFVLSRCGGCATRGFPATRAQNWSASQPLGFSSSLRSIRAAPHASALRFVTLRRLRDARLPCDSGSKLVCFAAPRFFVLAPVHPRCSARLRAS